MPSFHILIATIGRPSLQAMLDSILPFLTPVDHLTIVFDGVEPTNLHIETKGRVHLRREETALGSFGHAIRNKYAPLLERTDFVMHADDDDTYTPGAFDALRMLCIHPDTLYIARMQIVNSRIIPEDDEIRDSNVGTPNGIVPYDLNLKGTWGLKFGGDFSYYSDIKAAASKIVFLTPVIYRYNSVWVQYRKDLEAQWARERQNGSGDPQ
jgi:hypothetical protein